MFETRSRFGEELTRRLSRWRSTVVDHRAPFFAPVAAVVCLGTTLGQRLRRTIELIVGVGLGVGVGDLLISAIGTGPWLRSEEHTSELQSQSNLVCRLLLEKKKKTYNIAIA